MQREMSKLRVNNQHGNTELINYAHCEEFVGMSVIGHGKDSNISWIIDTRASSHMYKSLFVNLYDVSAMTSITLSSGKSKIVKQQGKIQISVKLIINACVYVSDTLPDSIHVT
ncbi:hypothetical protein LIER_34186 [Lithospermum erythrorhizon]|uniref:Uncharacterized protein n=1 Tax=Lithospermum erythrorhizon TaxID=34254 RepID=A0AAV3RYR9_LITER